MTRRRGLLATELFDGGSHQQRSRGPRSGRAVIRYERVSFATFDILKSKEICMHIIKSLTFQ